MAGPKAVQVTEDGDYETKAGVVHVAAGNWLVTDEDGTVSVVHDSVYEDRKG